MADQYNGNSGLHLVSDYNQDSTKQEFDGAQSMYRTASSSYQGSDSYFDEPYQAPYQTAGQDSIAGIMTGSFMYMFIALLVTGITAVVTVSSPTLLSALFSSSATFTMIFVVELVVVLAANAAMSHNNVVLSAVLFFTYAIVKGLTFSVIFLAYTSSSIEQAFFSTAVVFGLMALIGKVTDKDLTSIGSILLVGLLAVLLVSVVNIFIGSSAVDMAVTVVTIIIFLGLTAYDTQKIKKMAASNAGYSPAVISLWGAMELYLDFVNLFLRILRLMGKRK